MNRKATIKHSFLALPLFGAFIVACSSPSPVDEIVNSNMAARGGKERIQALNSIRRSGTATASGGRVAKVSQEIKRPGFYRLEFSSQGTKAVFAHDGEIGWHVAPLQGIFEPEVIEPDTNAEAGIDERDIEGPLVGWREKGHLVELEGREELSSGEAFKLKITLADGSIRYDFVDVASRQVVHSEKEEMALGRLGLHQATFTDFREVDGLVFPHRVETRVKNRPETIKIIVEKIELNPEIDDSRFQMPQ